MDSQIPFLCGDSEVCRTMGHPEAVNTTIRNIETNYLVVGVLEMLEETVTVLECLMPDMMNGLVETFHHTNVHKKSSHAAMPAAVMNTNTRQIMRNRLGHTDHPFLINSFKIYSFLCMYLHFSTLPESHKKDFLQL